MKIKITSEQSGERIDRFLVDNLPNFSRNQIQKLIKSNNIIVNDKAANAHYKLKENDIIKITKEKTPESIIKKQLKEKKDIPKLEIIADTPEYIVVNKPAGLTIHGARHIKEITLIDLVLQKYPKIKKIGEDPDRPGIMHRIDREVSGLVVIAKTQDSFDSLKKQFKERTIKKEYTALVFEKIEKDEDEINFPIDRASTGHKMAALPSTDKGKKNKKGKIAITKIEVIKKYINFTLIKVNIKTGRTHQIRVHMSAYGHPIVGDNLYSTRRTREQNKKLNLERIFLYANRLAFNDLSGEQQKFKIDMPEELKNFLEKIK